MYWPIQPRTNTIVATVPVGLDPQGLAFVPGGAFAYVANLLSNTLSVIATATNTVVVTVPIGVGPVGVATTPRVRR
jgi:YVTN family beta-propeller protein